jgi:hypothetical protein
MRRAKRPLQLARDHRRLCIFARTSLSVRTSSFVHGRIFVVFFAAIVCLPYCIVSFSRTSSWRRMSWCASGGTSMYSYRHECHASEDHIDAHEEPERPGSRARKSGKYDAGDDKIDNTADKNKIPTPRQLPPMLECVHDGGSAFDNEEDNQQQCK